MSKDFILVKFNSRQEKTCSSCLTNPQYFGIASGLQLIKIIHGFSEGKVKLRSNTLLHLGPFSVKLVMVQAHHSGLLFERFEFSFQAVLLILGSKGSKCSHNTLFRHNFFWEYLRINRLSNNLSN